LHRLEIIVPNGNVASLKVAQKCGAKEEGKLRQRVRSHGEYLDATMYSLIMSDLVRSEAT